jgi:esterase
MELFHRKMGQGQPLFILHGLFGSSDNWQTHAKVLSENYTVYLVDQRNHGRSPHSDEFDYDLLAQDLMELVAASGERDIFLIGHSMGGKTVLHFAQQYPYLVQKMIVADMGVKGYPPHHDLIFKALFAAEIDHCPSRKEAEERMLPFVEEPSTLQFLLKNLYWKEEGKLAWRFNLPALHANIGKIIGPIPPDRVEVETLFLRGELSNYVKDADWESIVKQVPHGRLETMSGVGHWLHAEAPAQFLEHVQRYFTA